MMSASYETPAALYYFLFVRFRYGAKHFALNTQSVISSYC
jgi:hypothetical protein